MFFVAEADIYRDRWYWTDQRVASAARTLRLAYQPLTGRWRVNIVSGLITSSSGLRATLNQNFDTLPEALSAVQRVARWKIAEAAEMDPDAALHARPEFPARPVAAAAPVPDWRGRAARLDHFRAGQGPAPADARQPAMHRRRGRQMTRRRHG